VIDEDGGDEVEDTMGVLESIEYEDDAVDEVEVVYRI
jgi:hypothetical protein